MNAVYLHMRDVVCKRIPIERSFIQIYFDARPNPIQAEQLMVKSLTNGFSGGFLLVLGFEALLHTRN